MTEMLLAEKWWSLQSTESTIEDGMMEAGLDDWSKIGGDPYDNSIEVYGVAPDIRFSAAILDWLLVACGFSKVYVNHVDGWETHYSTGNRRGWRRRYVSDPSATTTNVIAGPQNNGYFEVSYYPEGFPPTWLETGYMRIVPDPFDPALPTPQDREEKL